MGYHAGVRVATLNLNGLRSALRKGLLPWLEQEHPDVLLLQEVRADPHPELFAALGYGSVWNPARRKGYSGVALLAKSPIHDVRLGLGDPQLDDEGRLIAGVVGGVQFASVYLPSGSSGGPRQAVKDRSLERLSSWATAALARGPLVLGGDLNVAHRELDIRNWRANRGSSGFLPHEREWFGNLLALGLQDAHRESLGEAAAYTWWSNRAGAYQNDVGWRIDHLLAGPPEGLPGLGGVRLQDVRAHREARLSDHAPLSGLLTRVS